MSMEKIKSTHTDAFCATYIQLNKLHFKTILYTKHRNSTLSKLFMSSFYLARVFKPSKSSPDHCHVPNMTLCLLGWDGGL